MTSPNLANDTVCSLVACGSVKGSDGTAPLTGATKLRGVTAANIAHGTAGVYTIQLPADSVVTFTDGFINCTVVNSTAAEDPCWHLVSWTAGGLITLQFLDAATEADYDFIFDIWRYGIG